MKKLFWFAVAALVIFLGLALTAKADAIKVGGENGDYNRHFAPPLQSVLQTAWYDYPIELGAGTPDSMAWLCSNPEGVAFLQGNVYALGAPCDIEVIRADVGSEILLAVVADATLERLGGEEAISGAWARLTQVANRVKFVTSGENSGSGRTFTQLMDMDPEGLGRATSVSRVGGTDEIISAVAAGDAQVGFFVQSANPSNPRFAAIKSAGLTVIPVINRAMRGQEPIPGTNALPFELCQDVDVIKGGLFGSGAQSLTTACTPILIATGANNNAPDISTAVSNASLDSLLPQDGPFASLLKSMQRASRDGLDAAIDAAENAATAISDKL